MNGFRVKSNAASEWQLYIRWLAARSTVGTIEPATAAGNVVAYQCCLDSPSTDVDEHNYFAGNTISQLIVLRSWQTSWLLASVGQCHRTRYYIITSIAQSFSATKENMFFFATMMTVGQSQLEFLRAPVDRLLTDFLFWFDQSIISVMNQSCYFQTTT